VSGSGNIFEDLFSQKKLNLKLQREACGTCKPARGGELDGRGGRREEGEVLVLEAFSHCSLGPGLPFLLSSKLEGFL
jgi:hypothetical protein